MAAERLRTNDGHAHPTPEDELWTGTYSPRAMIGPALALAALTVLGGIARVVRRANWLARVGRCRGSGLGLAWHW